MLLLYLIFPQTTCNYTTK